MTPPKLQSPIGGRHLLVAVLFVLLVIIGLGYFWLTRPAAPTAQASAGAQPLRHSRDGGYQVKAP